jgi:glycosyltransferase involved in cell wall biosynthesis
MKQADYAEARKPLLLDTKQKISGISIVFPAYNDGETIKDLINSSLEVVRSITDNYEVIVTDDGSSDQTAEVLIELSRRCPVIKVKRHATNLGYGAALRSGFSAATKEWIFYTDGDAQYDPGELVNLVGAVNDNIDIVNGFKITRHDPIYRAVTGTIYQYLTRWLFGIHIKDVNCDFRLFRRKILDQVILCTDSGAIGVEMVKKIQAAGFKFIEVPVHHYPRLYGTSQFFKWRHLSRTVLSLASLWWQLVVKAGIKDGHK